MALTMTQAHDTLDRMAMAASEWCGLPVPIEGESLVVEPKHPAASVYARFNPDSGPDPEGRTVRSCFYSHKLRSDVITYIYPNGKLGWGVIPGVHAGKYILSTMGVSCAWKLSAEEAAMRKLKTLVSEHIYRMYAMTGCFLETSKRSGVVYIFRRLRPTIAMRPDADGDMRILTCLCLHPIAYYADSWAGGMVPTDDVIAHLLLMRGDEPMFWRRANQHAPHRPEAGLS